MIGDVTKVDPKQLEVSPVVDHVMRVSEPYKLANRAFHPEDSIIDVAGVKVGGDHLALIAGPCSVESKEQVIMIAKAAKARGANMLRGGASSQEHHLMLSRTVERCVRYLVSCKGRNRITHCVRINEC